MKSILVMTATGALLFAGTAVGVLVAQGRWSHEGTRGIPLLGALFPAPTATGTPEGEVADAAARRGAGGIAEAEAPQEPNRTGPRKTGVGGLPVEPRLPYRRGDSVLQPTRNDAGHGDGQGDPAGGHGGAARPERPQGEGTRPKAEGAGEPGAESATPPAPNGESSAEFQRKLDQVVGQGRWRPGRLFDFKPIEPGITVDEINEIRRRANEAMAQVERERAALDKRKSELDAREQDIRDRQEDVLKKMREIEQARVQLEKDAEEFARRVVLIRADEEKGLKEVARSVAAQTPTRAAAILAEWWGREDTQARALKVLTLMETEAADAILAEMKESQVREVLDKRLRVLREDKKQGR